MTAGETPTAIVVGASGPVGAAVAMRLVASGYRVAGIDDRTSPGTLSLVVDGADLTAIAGAITAAREQFGRPAAVLVTAPDVPRGQPFGSLDDAAWRRILRASLGATGAACAAVLPDMVAAGGGTIVTWAPPEAVVGMSGGSYAAAATGTILAFTKSLAVEVAPGGVRANCVVGGSPEAVADTVEFLVTAGDFYVGQVFTPVDSRTSE